MVEIFTTPACAQCMQAKTVLKKNDIPFVEIDARENIADMSSRIGKDVRTVPQIFANGKYIGGFSELMRLLSCCITDIKGDQNV